MRSISSTTIISACIATATLLSASVGTLAISTTASAESTSTNTAITLNDLADSSSAQQRWISEPTSRIALNPSHSQTDDAKPTSDDSLDTVFYTNQDKKTADNVVRNSFTDTAQASTTATAYDEGDATPALSDDFGPSDEGSWTATNGKGSISFVDNAGIVAPSGGDTWVGFGRSVTFDAAAKPIIMVTVASTTGKWALKINDGSSDTNLQNDTDATGTFAYDLSDFGISGSKAYTIKIFSSNSGTTTFKSLSIHARPAQSDDFTQTSIKDWMTNVQSNNGATISQADSGLGATIRSTSSSNFGAVAKAFTVDLSKTPILTVAVNSLSAGSKWALKLSGANGSGDFAIIQNDTDRSGVFSYDLQSMTGKTGEQTFSVKLFSTQSALPTSFNVTRLSFHSIDYWTQNPTDYVNTWNPQSLDWKGSYGDSGSYSTQDLFVDDATVSRLIDPTSLSDGNPTLTGNFTGTVSWNPTDRVLTINNGDAYTRAVAFPASATVSFYDSQADASMGADGSSTPTATSQTWLAIMPNDQKSAIGLGYAYDATAQARTDAAKSAVGGTKVDTVVAALASRVKEWSEFLNKVPAVGDYSLHVTDYQGTSQSEIRAMYYRAFVDLRQTVVPPQPESGISHYQVATGKAATYNGGSSRNKASASWDSLLGIDYLAYTDPEYAWDSFIGMMADVQSDGNLNGESLPSRKAQTAWMLYSVTGDKDKLRQVYSAVKAHMTWSSKNLAWNIASHYPGSGVPASDERDLEFVASLAVDLGYASKIAATLGETEDVSYFTDVQKNLSSEFSQWFFKDGKAVQYYWTSKADATYDQRKGSAQYVATGLHMPNLSSGEVAALMARFDEEYDPSQQFAGLASDAVKAPDIQFVAYGLLEQGKATEAETVLEEVLRDVVRTHEFSEVYQAGATDSSGKQAEPISRGESPTTFGMAQVIDNLWILNGYRSDEGTPTFARLREAQGGVSGLTYMGKTFSISNGGSEITLSGDVTSIPGTCTQYGQTVAVSYPISFTCGTIALSGTSVEAGKSLVVTGARYTPSTVADLYLGDLRIASATVDKNGAVRFNAVIPSDTATGRHTLRIQNGDITAQAQFDVTASRPGSGGGNSGGGTTNGGKTNAAGGNVSEPKAGQATDASAGASVHTGGSAVSPMLWMLGIALSIIGAGGAIAMRQYRMAIK
ncbi:hypothetical protein [Bifidobacterium sp.]|uniref:alpha-L-rhamnosidase-related protein n=1 Tax=Bifidobacterium sp. TaxID=41200 RepID=UPI0039E879A5